MSIPSELTKDRLSRAFLCFFPTSPRFDEKCVLIKGVAFSHGVRDLGAYRPVD